MAKSNKTAQPPIKQTQTTSAPQRSRKKRLTITAIVLVVVLFVFNLLTGYISYGLMTVWCMRLPITANDFAADYHYSVPGQTSYGPNMFASYYCTEQEARDAGFNPAHW